MKDVIIKHKVYLFFIILFYLIFITMLVLFIINISYYVNYLVNGFNVESGGIVVKVIDFSTCDIKYEIQGEMYYAKLHHLFDASPGNYVIYALNNNYNDVCALSTIIYSIGLYSLLFLISFIISLVLTIRFYKKISYESLIYVGEKKKAVILDVKSDYGVYILKYKLDGEICYKEAFADNLKEASKGDVFDVYVSKRNKNKKYLDYPSIRKNDIF